MTETLDNPPRNHESPAGESELATDNRWFGNLLTTPQLRHAAYRVALTSEMTKF